MEDIRLVFMLAVFLALVLWIVAKLDDAEVRRRFQEEKRKKAEESPSEQQQFARQVEVATAVRQKELEIKQIMANLASLEYSPAETVLLELEMNEKKLELQLMTMPLEQSERERLQMELAVIRGQIEKQKGKVKDANG